MARRYAETRAQRWFIPSAAHGLLDPEQVTDPYDISLNWMTTDQRRDRAKLVRRQMDIIDLRGPGTAVILAGLNYENLCAGVVVKSAKDGV
jgi:hypothetical protein